MIAKGVLVLIPTGPHNGSDDDPPPPASFARAAGLKRGWQEREGQILRAVQIRPRPWVGAQAALAQAA